MPRQRHGATGILNEKMLWLPCHSAVRGRDILRKLSVQKMSPYPPETALFTPLPMLCISSPMPRIVAHPSEVKTTKSNVHRINLFFFILPSKAVNHAAIASVFLLVA